MKRRAGLTFAASCAFLPRLVVAQQPRVARIGVLVPRQQQFRVGEVLEPEKRKAAMVEFDPGHDHFSGRPVEFVYVAGSPKLSRIILRPWLRAG